MTDKTPEGQPIAEKAETSAKVGNRIVNDLRDALAWIGSPQGIVTGIMMPFTIAGVFTVLSRLGDEAGALTEETRIHSSGCTAVSYPGLLTKKLYENAYYDFKDQTVTYSFNVSTKSQVVGFSQLSKEGRIKAREVAEKMPLECRYQKKFDL